MWYYICNRCDHKSSDKDCFIEDHYHHYDEDEGFPIYLCPQCGNDDESVFKEVYEK